jgi:transcriptional regulator with XRE-family HTH domain
MPQQTFEDVVIAEIKAEMARQDISQGELGRRVGTSQTWVSKRLTHTVPLRAQEIEQIADALGVSISQLGWPIGALRSVRRVS